MVLVEVYTVCYECASLTCAVTHSPQSGHGEFTHCGKEELCFVVGLISQRFNVVLIKPMGKIKETSLHLVYPLK